MAWWNPLTWVDGSWFKSEEVPDDEMCGLCRSAPVGKGRLKYATEDGIHEMKLCDDCSQRMDAMAKERTK